MVNAGPIISSGLIETSQPFQIFAESDRIENLVFLPEQIPGFNFGEHLAEELGLGEFAITNDLDFLDTPLSCGVEIIELDRHSWRRERKPSDSKQEE
jgi:hypothetical protein